MQKGTEHVNMVQKHRHVPWAKAHLKWTVSKCKKVLWSDESKFDLLVGNQDAIAKEEGELPLCYQRSVQKPVSLMGVHKCIQYGQLACFGRHYESIKVLEQHMLPSRWRLFQGRLVYVSRTMQNYTLQLLQQHGFVVEKIRCWIGLPAVQSFHL